VRHRRLVAALVLLGLALYVFPLALDHPLIDPDEDFTRRSLRQWSKAATM